MLDKAKALIPSILETQDLMTYVIRNKLHYDHHVDLRTYQVRSLLRQLEKEGVVEVTASVYKKQLKWKKVKH